MSSTIKTLRVRAGLTQGELAQRIGIRQTAVSQWERGRTSPGVKNLHKLAKILDCPVDALMKENASMRAVLGEVSCNKEVASHG